MDDREFLAWCQAQCRTAYALFHEDDIARLANLSGVDGIDYVSDGSGYKALTPRLVDWLVEMAEGRATS